MAITLYNPTEEVMEFTYIGEYMEIPPAPDERHMVRVDDARGRFALNFLGPKGLVSLEFGDEGEGIKKKAEIGRRENRKFWTKQVMDFNQINDQRAMQKQPYIAPQPAVRAAAARLGIKLIEPMATQDQNTLVTKDLSDKLEEKDRQLNEQREENAKLRSEFQDMKAMLQALLATKAKSAEQEVEDLKNKIKTINGKVLRGWVASNFNEIMGFPEEVQALVRERYEKFYDIPLPATKEQALALAE